MALSPSDRAEVYAIVREVVERLYLSAGTQTELDTATQDAIKLCDERIESGGERT